MANTVWRSINAGCPYYLRSNDYSITCALSEDGKETIRRKFRTRKGCHACFKTHCIKSNPRHCPVAGLIKTISPDQ